MARYVVLGFCLAAVTFGMLLAYGMTSSLRHGPNSEEYRRLSDLYQSGDIAALNAAAMESRSLSAKLVALSYLKELKDSDSIPILVSLLSFDLPWYDKLDSDLSPTPQDVRLSAQNVLGSFPLDQVETTLTPLLASRNRLERLHAAGVLSRWGNPDAKNVLVELSQSKDSRFRAEVLTAKRMAETRRP